VDRNSGQTHNVRMGEIFFENVAKIKYLGTAVTNQTSFKKLQEG
jgi:hypothetical protein